MNDIENRLLGLLNLEEGWHFGEGNRISEESVLIAIAITRKINSTKVSFIEAFPTEDGFVNLRFGITQNIIIGIIIQSKTEIVVYRENDIDIKEIKTVELSKIISFITKQVDKIKEEMNYKRCATLDYYTVNPILKHKSNSYHTLYSNSGNCENLKKVSPYLTATVWNKVIEPYVISSTIERKNSKMQLQCHMFSGKSIQTHYRAQKVA